MKLLQINSVYNYGSTGRICRQIDDVYQKSHLGESRILYFWGPDSESNCVTKCGTKSYAKVMALKARITGKYGFVSKKSTMVAIRNIEQFKPDIIHLHNIHDHTVDLDLLFSYIKASNIKIVWTFHDCWAFTAYCPHFTFANCEMWKTGCKNCPQRRAVSWFFDRSAEIYWRKKELFSGLDLAIVTPSQWLAGLVKQSFLKDYPVKVIPNGIDLSVFKPVKSNFRQKHLISDNQYLVLGVAFDWGQRKGLDVFIELVKRVNPDKYRIVLVGTNDAVDKQLPDNIISVHRTQNQQELAEIYTAADVFVNPTREDTFPTVNLEALACGTPVITFDTGGSPEIIDSKSGISINQNNDHLLIKSIVSICEKKIIHRSDCINRGRYFDSQKRFEEYLKLYNDIYYFDR